MKPFDFKCVLVPQQISNKFHFRAAMWRAVVGEGWGGWRCTGPGGEAGSL